MTENISEEIIWILDDEKQVTEVIEDDLSEYFQTRTFNEPQKVIEELRLGTNPPSLLISDISMPQKNGLQVTKEIYKELDIQIPVILISGFADKRYALEALELGVSRIVEKPFSPNQLYSAVKDVMAIAQLEKLNHELINAYRHSIVAMEGMVDKFRSQSESIEKMILEKIDNDGMRTLFHDYLSDLPDQDSVSRICDQAHTKIAEIERTLKTKLSKKQAS